MFGALVVLSASIVVLAMSGGGATDVTDSNTLEVDKITDVDFVQISGARVVVSVGTMSDCKVWFTVQDSLQFASWGASESLAKKQRFFSYPKKYEIDP